VKILGIIFDCDGVLIMNTNSLYDRALENAVNFVEPNYSTKEIYNVISKSQGKTFTHQLKLILGENHQYLCKAIERYEAYIHLPENYNQIYLLKGSYGLLNTLKEKGIILALATGMNPSLLTRLKKEKILPCLFDNIGLTHDISDPKYQKPHPKILIDLLEQMHLLYTDVAYVGDTIDDIVMAKESLIYSIAVLTGRLTEKEAKEVGADLVLSSVLEVGLWI
jgi:phosphoglycolate phosphatase